jgi:hypothetical protein
MATPGAADAERAWAADRALLDGEAGLASSRDVGCACPLAARRERFGR